MIDYCVNIVNFKIGNEHVKSSTDQHVKIVKVGKNLTPG